LVLQTQAVKAQTAGADIGRRAHLHEGQRGQAVNAPEDTVVLVLMLAEISEARLHRRIDVLTKTGCLSRTRHGPEYAETDADQKHALSQ